MIDLSTYGVPLEPQGKWTISSDVVDDFLALSGVTVPEDIRFLFENIGVFRFCKERGGECLDSVIVLSERKFARNFICFQQTRSPRVVIDEYLDNSGDIPGKCLKLIECEGGAFFVCLRDGFQGSIFYMERDPIMEENDEVYADSMELDDAIEAFAPEDGIVPYYFTWLSDSLSDFFKKIEFIEL